MTHENAFREVETATVVLNSRGTFSVHVLAVRQGQSDRVYAAVGNKYIRLQAGGFTSKAGVSWEDIYSDGNSIKQDKVKGPVWQ